MEVFIRNIVKHLPISIRKKLSKRTIVVEITLHESRRLNRQYLKKNKPANVLAFRYGKDYGEILVCPEIIRREAKKQGNSYKYQMTWMILHGTIHLTGLHHEKSKAMRKKFERIEKSVLRKLF